MTDTCFSAPKGYATVTPYLTIQGAAEAIEYYKTVFNATERMRLASPDGKVMHAELQIGNSVIMLSDTCPEWGNQSPLSLGGSAVTIHLYVDNADIVVDRALVHGASLISAVRDQFYGDRSGSVTDPYGHNWHIATHVEDVTPEEIQKRVAGMFSGACAG